MKKAEDITMSMLDNVVIGISMISPKMEIIWLNKTFKKWFPNIEVREKPLCYQSFYSPPKEKICDYCPTIKAFKTGEIHSSETGVCVGGKIYNVIATPVKDEKGITYVVETVEDVTERKQAEEVLHESEDKYRAFFEQAADSIVLIDAETGALVEFNNKACENLGYNRKEFQKLKIPDFEIIESAEEVSEHIKEIIKKGAGVFETKHRRKDGQIRDILVSSRAISVGGRDFIQSIWYDITERKKAEEEIRCYGERLRILCEIDHAILSAQSTEKIIHVALGHIHELVPVQRASLTLFDFDADKATILADNTTGKTKLGAGMSFSLKDYVVREELLKGKVHVCEDISIISKPTTIDKKLKAEGVRSYINVPLIFQGELIGSLNMGKDTPGAFASEDVTIASEVADILAVAIQQVRHQEELKKSEEKYHDLYDNAPDMCYSIDKNGIIIDCNETWVKMLGYKKEETLGRPLTDFYTEKSKGLFKKIFPGLIKEKNLLNVEREFIRKDGTTFPAILNVFVEYDKSGKLIRTRAIARDITERKQAEEILKDSEEKFRTIFENASDAIFIHDLEGHFLEVNRVVCERLGYSREELLQMTPMDIDSPEYAALVPQRIKELCKRGHIFFETAHVRRDGTTIPIELSSRIIEYAEKPAVLSIARDITERKQVEEILKKSEKKYRNLIDNALLGVFKTNIKGDILYVNKALSNIFEYDSPEEMMRYGVLKLYKNPEDRKAFIENLKKTGKVSDFEFEGFAKTGETKRILLSATLEGGAVSGMVMDVTEQRYAEDAIRKSEIFLSSILEGIQDGVVVLDRDFRILFANSGYIGRMKNSSNEIKGKHCYGVLYNRDEPCYSAGLKCSVKNVFETGLSSTEIRKKDGNYIEVIVYPLKDSSGKVISVVEIRRDVTKSVQLNEEVKNRIKELEKFYDMAVGRELKMVELKEEIERLKEELRNEK